jgi:hypothetical protein
MANRLSTGIARGLDRLSARLSPAPPPAPERQEPPPIPPEIDEKIGGVQAMAEDALARADYALEVACDVSLPAKLLAFMSWLELHPPSGGPTISVVLATRDRAELLARAIPSVLAQRYGRWELVVVDDGDTDAVARTLTPHDDERIVSVEGPRRGLGAARNAGLDRAGGEVVCYLDDDNIMHPAWLHAIADVFGRREDVDVAYGIAIAEHRIPGDLGEHGWWPSFWQIPWSRETLLEQNLTDAGSIAHRRELDEARFDEELTTGEDWDLLLRLTADRDALAIPALSHAYSMDGADRMSVDPGHEAGLEKIRRRHADR